MTMFYIMAIGSLPFTIWNAEGDGVPRADEWVIAGFGLTLGSLVLLSAFFGAFLSSFDPPIAPKLHLGWFHTYVARIPAMLTVGTIVVAMPTSLVPLAMGKSMHFLFLDNIAFLAGFAISIPLGEAVARWSVGSKAPVRNSVRRLRQNVLLLRDDEGEGVVSPGNGCFVALLSLFSLFLPRSLSHSLLCH